MSVCWVGAATIAALDDKARRHHHRMLNASLRKSQCSLTRTRPAGDAMFRNPASLLRSPSSEHLAKFDSLMNTSALNVEQVVRAVRRRIGDIHRPLPEEFRPAHLSVALIDAVFNPTIDYCRNVVPIVNRYCSRFGLRRTTMPCEWETAPGTQETLGDLIGHYDELGAAHLRMEVFRSCHRSPGTSVYKADNVLNCARALYAIGVNVLQDVPTKCSEEIWRTLCAARGIGPSTAHMLLMYAGKDDCVKGDRHVCDFVCEALGVNRVSPRLAESLVAGAARQLGVAPRALDAQI